MYESRVNSEEYKAVLQNAKQLYGSNSIERDGPRISTSHSGYFAWYTVTVMSNPSYIARDYLVLAYS